MNRYFALEGLDATGKTTVANLLRKKFTVIKTPPDNFPIPRHKYDSLPVKHRFFWYLKSVKFAVDQAPKGIVFFDRYVLSTITGHEAMGLKLDNFKPRFPKPEMTFILTVNEEERLKRLNNREILKHDIKNIKIKDKILKGYEKWSKELGHNCIYIDTSNITPEQVCKQIMDCIDTDKTLLQILKGHVVDGRDSTTYEDERVYQDIPLMFKWLHKSIIKNISKVWSSRILQNELIETVGDVENKTIIDVSTGDDELVLKLAKKAKSITANDICPKTMQPLKQKKVKNIVFTGDNLLKIDGRKKYDVVICKNTLHHLNTVKQIEIALKKLKRLKAKNGKIIIMDIENPSMRLRARLWNAYYVFMLKDQGGFFISYKQFVDMLSVPFKGMTIKTKKVNTIKGSYMLAEIY